MNATGDGAIFLEGNCDGKGRSRLGEWKFSNLVSTYGSKYQYIKYISWPNAPEYTACNHKYQGAGICSSCGHEFDWQSTFDATAAGVYRIVESFTPRTDKPYDAGTKANFCTIANDEVDVVGSYTNAYGSKWYKYVSDGNNYYVYEDYLKFAGYGEQVINCTITSPTENATVPKESYPVAGTVTSKYPLKKVEAYIDGQKYTTINLGTQTSLDIRSSNINYSLDFAALDPGSHTLILKACDIHHDTMVQIIKRNFSIEGKADCSHPSYSSKVTKPTCVAQGYTTYTCTKCEYSYKDNYTEIADHSYGSWQTVTAATCTASGTEKQTCAVCKHEKTRTVNALGHNYQSVTYDATCTEYAKTVYTCSNCKDSYTEYNSNEMSDWSTTKPSGVDESLIESRTEYQYRTKEYTTSTESSMNGWTQSGSTTQWSEYGEWSDWSTSAVGENTSTQVETRTAYAYYYYRCPNCGAHMHGWGITCPTWAGGCGKGAIKSEHYVKVWSTTSYDAAGLKDFHGTGKYYANVDGQRVFRHEDGSQKQYRYRTRSQETVYEFYRWSNWSGWSATAVSATNDREVKTRTVYRYATGGLEGHRFTENVTVPTCTAKGYTTHTCSICGDSYTDSYVNAKGHTEITVSGTAATCTKSGLTDGKKCSTCGAVTVSQQTIAALGHNWVDATCTTAKTCSVCGATEGNALGHTEITVSGKAATCTKSGLTDGKKCSTCGAVTVSQQTITALGHDWTDATCTTAKTCSVCKATEGAALGHDMGEWVTTKEPTTTAEGEKTRTCNRNCGHTETEKLLMIEQADGWAEENGKWYYYKSGKMLKNEWLQSGSRWYYLDADGVMATGWVQVGGKWYLMGSGGNMLTGWQKSGGKWYYLNSHMRTGWIQSGGVWYYMDASGAMRTGWKQVGGKWYYMDASGAMQTGWEQVSGKWYYLGSDGSMKAGWQYTGGKWYYMDASGAMQTGWEQVGGKWYYLGSDGAMRTGWVQQGGTWYYMNSSGEMVTGTQTIGGKTYVFNSSGVWIK